MEENRVHWEGSISTLESLYKDVERRSLSLPAFSLTPLAICIWNVIKLEVTLLLDLSLALPMNFVIFLRNLFPGRWDYRSFSGKYWRYAITWIWRGEAPTLPLGVIRPLVTFMVTMHVHSRFRTIDRHIYLDSALTEEDRNYLAKKATGVLDHWKRPTAVQIVYTYVLPAGGPLIGIYKFLFPGDLPQWVVVAGFSLLGYAITFVVSAFMFKRSLMLGASGRSIFFPGAISGNQIYARDRDTLASVGISTREWPSDVALLFVSLAIGYSSIRVWFEFYESLGVKIPSNIAVQMIVQGSIFVALILVSLFRRKKTGRS